MVIKKSVVHFNTFKGDKKEKVDQMLIQLSSTIIL